MNCQGCGHNYPNTLTRCPRCKMLSGRRTQKASDSRLIEFPRKARPAEQTETVNTSLPQWRQDLNEKVRAIQARRSNPAMAGASAVKAEESAVAAPHFEGRTKGHVTGETAAVINERGAGIDVFSQGSLTAEAPARNANPIVEKALSRVRRASENARREYLPKIEPAKPVRPSYTVENEATARALEPSAEINVKESPAALPAIAANPAEIKSRPSLDVSAVRTPTAKPIAVEASRTTKPLEPLATPSVSSASVATPVAASPARQIIPQSVVEPIESYGANDFDADDFSSVVTIDEIEPVDYLEAEIRKVDRALTAELHRDDRLSSVTHLFIGAIDLAVIVLSALPFIALIGLYNGNFALAPTRAAGLVITLMIAFFYLALTQSLCGRTFGMMLTNTRLIDAFTGEPVSAARSFIRTIGCFVAAAPAFIGLLWGAFSPQRRGLQDYIAGTRIVSDF